MTFKAVITYADMDKGSLNLCSVDEDRFSHVGDNVNKFIRVVRPANMSDKQYCTLGFSFYLGFHHFVVDVEKLKLIDIQIVNPTPENDEPRDLMVEEAKARTGARL